jgi:hypothetical protein
LQLDPSIAAQASQPFGLRGPPLAFESMVSLRD